MFGTRTHVPAALRLDVKFTTRHELWLRGHDKSPPAYGLPRASMARINACATTAAVHVACTVRMMSI
jgi:hypothetical protein